jgi:putative transposase
MITSEPKKTKKRKHNCALQQANELDKPVKSQMEHLSNSPQNITLDSNNCLEEKDFTANNILKDCSSQKKRKPIKIQKVKRREKNVNKTKKKKRSKSVTQGSHPPTKEKICKDKSTSCKKTTPITKLSKTSDRDLTITDLDLLPFWNKSTLEMSKKLSFRTKTDCVDLDMNWSSGCSNNQTQNCWYTVTSRKRIETKEQEQKNQNLETISSPLSTTLLQAIMEDAQLKTNERENAFLKKEETRMKRRQALNKGIQNKRRKKQMEEEQKEEKLMTDEELMEVEQQFKKCKKRKKTQVDQNEKSDDDDIIIKPPAYRVIKYKLFTNHEQTQQLKKIFGVTTWTYNQCVAAYKDKKFQDKDISVKTLRNYCVSSDCQLVQDNPWVKEIPYDLRDEAVKDFVQAWKALQTKKSKGDKHSFHADFKFQHKYRKSRKIVIHSKHWKKPGHIYSYTDLFSCGENLPLSLEYDSSITLNWLGEFHLLLPRQLEKFEHKTIAPKPVVAIDPGVRTFSTLYDPVDDIYTEWGKNDMGMIYRMIHHISKLQSKIDKTTNRHGRKWRMKRALRRMYKRVKNLVTDFHYRFSHWLCSNYQVILLPYYDIRNMVRRGCRKINNKTVRGMLTWSPCTFRDRLIGVSRRYPGCHVRLLSEAWTSKTCRDCGFLHHKLGGNKVFKCPSCFSQYPRDEGGASNIFLRHITSLFPPESH